MNLHARFAYAQARCQARFAVHTRTAWNAYADGDNTGNVTVESRARLHPLLATVSTDTGLHDVERLTRAVFKRIIADVTRWVPQAWRAAIGWLAIIVDLPAIQHLLDGGEAYAWLQDDAQVALWMQVGTKQNPLPQELREWLPLVTQRVPGETLADTWCRCWQQRWPPDERAAHRQLLRLKDMMLRSRQSLLNRNTADAAVEAGRLEQQLIRFFRQDAQTPAAICAYLGLVWMELLRFRAGLIGHEFALRQD